MYVGSLRMFVAKWLFNPLCQAVLNCTFIRVYVAALSVWVLAFHGLTFPQGMKTDISIAMIGFPRRSWALLDLQIQGQSILRRSRQVLQNSEHPACEVRWTRPVDSRCVQNANVFFLPVQKKGKALNSSASNLDAPWERQARIFAWGALDIMSPCSCEWTLSKDVVPRLTTLTFADAL